jgi:hypothetical protein
MESNNVFASVGGTLLHTLEKRENVWSGTSPIDPVQQPFALFLVQILIILLFSRFLGLGLQLLKQPRVIAG